MANRENGWMEKRKEKEKIEGHGRIYMKQTKKEMERDRESLYHEQW